ncbi:hypothetical protein ACIQUD_31790 [Streptomyces globisporus]|uniref:hypothetical protein n=1 Tax=Streptomyces globisporus TaxID=1908 RepID=UPI00381ED9D4
MDDANALIRQAKQAIDGSHHAIPARDGHKHAIGRALVALAEQQQETNQHLASIAQSLAVLAAATAAPANPDGSEPKRRLWLPTRRKTA